MDYSKVKIINKAFLPKQQVSMTPKRNPHYPDGLTGSDISQDDYSILNFKKTQLR